MGSSVLLQRVVSTFIHNPAVVALVGNATVSEVEDMPYVGHRVTMTIPGLLVQADPSIPDSKAFVTDGKTLIIISNIGTSHPTVQESNYTHQKSVVIHILKAAEGTRVINLLLEVGWGGFSLGCLRSSYLLFDTRDRGPYTYVVEEEEKQDEHMDKENDKSIAADGLRQFKATAAQQKFDSRNASIALRITTNKNKK